MRDSEGNKLMSLWKCKTDFNSYIIAAWTRKEVNKILKDNGYLWSEDITYNITRIKNCFASFKEGKILT